jgi:Animal haem peroxidase
MRSALITAAAILVMATPTAHAGSFGRLFPNLPGLSSHTVEEIAELARIQRDPNLDARTNLDNPSGFTYFGQFVDHDLTRDTSPLPTGPVDPATLLNGRTLALDLDSVYGGGPIGSPELFEADGLHFRVQPATATTAPDLARTGSDPLNAPAIIADGRNDENQIISQLHLAFLKAHNKLVDQGLSFDDARQTLRWHYQKAVVDDFLPHILEPGTLPKNIPPGHVPELYRDLEDAGITPVEFAVAAYRFGHSMVRLAYQVSDTSGNIQVFNAAGNDLRGGRALPLSRQIDWGNFFQEVATDQDLFNSSRMIDPLISRSLFFLSPGSVGGDQPGINVLGLRNMIRAKFYDMPSGQAVAEALGAVPISAADVEAAWYSPAKVAEHQIPQTPTPVDHTKLAAFANGTPLWFYMLAEAGMQEDGRTLGTVGSRVVGETFLAALVNDHDSYLRRHGPNWKPDPAIAGADDQMQVADILAFAEVLNPT